MSSVQHQDLQPAFVLHSRPYRDTSLLLEVFSREQGRVGLVARGARAPRSRIRGLLQPFQPLLLSWQARGDLGTLRAAEADGAAVALRGNGLFSGFYLNELLVRLLHRNDPHPDLFPLYTEVLSELAAEADLEPVLRRYELRLLELLGYGLLLDHEVESGGPVDPDADYEYILERGPMPRLAQSGQRALFRGSSLLGMAAEQFEEPQVRKDAKRLLRAALDLYLGKTPLKTREVIRQLVNVR